MSAHETHKNTQGKASAKNHTISIILQGGNMSEVHKALALIASHLSVESSWMLIGNQSFSQAFSCALQASYFLAQFLWVILLLPSVTLITHTDLTPCKTAQSSRNLNPSSWMIFLYRKNPSN